MTGTAFSTAERFHRLIASHGPITLQHFMGESNARYYAGRDPFGSAGDFITAPEISQIFGEMIGLWLADIWTRAGRPQPVHYVELGPGRGTLAADALRAMKQFGLEPQVHLVEGSPELREIQRAAVPGAALHDDLASVPGDAPLLLVANEFFDALPIRQLIRTAEGWRELMVASDGTRFALAAGDQPMDSGVPAEQRDADEGTVLETCPGAAAVMTEIAARLTAQGGAALLIDYGHTQPRTGSTLQAIRAHEKVDPLAMPGEADLTAHVDFHQLAETAQSSGARWLGTTGQGAFLQALGAHARARTLGEKSPDKQPQIQSALYRLTAADQMGELFKVMGLVGADWPDGAGFDLA